MPGITGLAGKTANMHALPRMLGRLRHHAWYARSEWVAARGEAGLGRVALGLINVASQPVANEDGSKHAVLEGEVYDYAAHRRRLEAAGHIFVSVSHAELILHGLEEEGAPFLRRLEGSFSAAVWDGVARRLTLVNDCFGMRPLYYAHLPGRLLFGSELK